jgi:hypothetical protein
MKLMTFHVLNRFGLANPDALGVSVAKIALVRKSQIWVKTHGSGRAGRNAHFATHTKGFVQDHSVEVGVTTNSTLRACGGARGIDALLARDGQEKEPGTIAVPHDVNA